MVPGATGKPLATPPPRVADGAEPGMHETRSLMVPNGNVASAGGLPA